jgi:hypothetical protein
LNLSLEGINALSVEYDRESKALKEELFRLCWYMRGSLSFTESYLLTYEDRLIISKIIEENLETTKTSQMPFF